jgi:hypothetical protein
MQTPNRIYFYWTFRQDPAAALRGALANGSGAYQLIIKLVNLKNVIEEIHPVDGEGSWWFDVDADSQYRGEVGFFAPNRPFIRIMYSNTLETPRRRPSPRTATDSDWKVSAENFAGILNVSGFRQDSFDFVVRGNDESISEERSRAAFAELMGDKEVHTDDFSSEELRFALFYLAAGLPLDDLRWRIDSSLFQILQKHFGQIRSKDALAIVKEYFDIESEEFVESTGAVYGSSVINFPRILKKRFSYEPVSS